MTRGLKLECLRSGAPSIARGGQTVDCLVEIVDLSLDGKSGMERAAVTAEHYRRLRPAERVVALRFLRGRLTRELHIATKICDVERQDSLVALLALVRLALPEAATQSATSTLFVFNEAIVALGGSEGRPGASPAMW
jgi:hypothetical protein